MLNALSELALLCGIHNSVFASLANAVRLSFFPTRPQNLSILGSCGRSLLSVAWKSISSSLSLSSFMRNCGNRAPSLYTEKENKLIYHNPQGRSCQLTISDFLVKNIQKLPFTHHRFTIKNTCYPYQCLDLSPFEIQGLVFSSYSVAGNQLESRQTSCVKLLHRKLSQFYMKWIKKKTWICVRHFNGG